MTTPTVKAMLKKKPDAAEVLTIEGLKEELTRLGERIEQLRQQAPAAVLVVDLEQKTEEMQNLERALEKGLLDLRALTNLVPTPDEMDFGAYWPMLADHVATGAQLIIGQLQVAFGFKLSKEEASKEFTASDAAGERYVAAMEKERAAKPAIGSSEAWRAWVCEIAYFSPKDVVKKSDDEVRAMARRAIPTTKQFNDESRVNAAIGKLIEMFGAPDGVDLATVERADLLDNLIALIAKERGVAQPAVPAPILSSPMTSFRANVVKMTALRDRVRFDNEGPVFVAAEEPAAVDEPATEATHEPATDEPTDKAPPVLLAHKWDVDVDLTGWWMSEKLDGVRAYWNGVNFVSRLGNVFHAPAWFTADFPKHPLDGELWLSRQEFQKCVSVVRRHDAGDEWKQICFVVFDAPHLEAPFEERFSFLQEHFGDGSTTPYIRVLEQVQLENIEQLKAELARVEGLGGEGLMMRQPGSLYEAGRSHTLLKVKTFHDDEAVVVEHEPGKGKHKGRLGALVCMSTTGKRFNVGTGFSDAEREAPPAIGETVTYRYQELTKDGIPRFPSYVGRAIDKPAVVVEDREHVVSRVNTVKGQASVRVYAQTEPVGITTTWGPLETAIRWPSYAEAEKRHLRGSIVVDVADIPATLAADEIRAAERAAAKASA